MSNFGLLFTKTSTAKGGIDVEYLDELSEKKASEKSRREGIDLNDIKAEQSALSKELDYMSKEEKGKVQAGGWVRNRLLRKGQKRPEDLDNQTRKDLIRQVMKKHTETHGEYRGAHGHKLVFSLSNDLEKRLEEADIDKENELQRIFKRVMKDFEKEFHNRELSVKSFKTQSTVAVKDMIGYAWGVHHDTDNLHIHCYLHNRTLFGHHVACSNPLKNKKDVKPRADQIGFIKQKLHDYEVALNRKIDKVLEEKYDTTILPELRRLAADRSTDKPIEPPKYDNRKPYDFNKIRLLNSQYQALQEYQREIKNIYTRTYTRGILSGLMNELIKKDRRERAAALRKKYFAVKKQYELSMDEYIIESLAAHSVKSDDIKAYKELVKTIKNKRYKKEDVSKEIDILNQIRKALNVSSRYSKNGYLDKSLQKMNSVKTTKKSSKDLKSIFQKGLRQTLGINEKDINKKV